MYFTPDAFIAVLAALNAIKVTKILAKAVGRTIPINKIKQILSLYKQGESKRSTARKLKISRNTVKQYSLKFKKLHNLHPEVIEDENNLIKHLFPDVYLRDFYQ